MGGWIRLRACAPAETGDFAEENGEGGGGKDCVNVCMLVKEKEQEVEGPRKKEREREREHVREKKQERLC